MANKIYNDLSKTPFMYEVENYKFFFSSAFHKNKFIKKYKEYCKEENIKFNNRYKVKVDLKELFMIAFYIKCENRGFKILFQNLPLDEKQVRVIIL